jgi:hypothetical protein
MEPLENQFGREAASMKVAAQLAQPLARLVAFVRAPVEARDSVERLGLGNIRERCIQATLGRGAIDAALTQGLPDAMASHTAVFDTAAGKARRVGGVVEITPLAQLRDCRLDFVCFALGSPECAPDLLFGVVAEGELVERTLVRGTRARAPTGRAFRVLGGRLRHSISNVSIVFSISSAAMSDVD